MSTRWKTVTKYRGYKIANILFQVSRRCCRFRVVIAPSDTQHHGNYTRRILPVRTKKFVDLASVIRTSSHRRRHSAVARIFNPAFRFSGFFSKCNFSFFVFSVNWSEFDRRAIHGLFNSNHFARTRSVFAWCQTFRATWNHYSGNCSAKILKSLF